MAFKILALSVSSFKASYNTSFLFLSVSLYVSPFLTLSLPSRVCECWCLWTSKWGTFSWKQAHAYNGIHVDTGKQLQVLPLLLPRQGLFVILCVTCVKISGQSISGISPVSHAHLVTGTRDYRHLLLYLVLQGLRNWTQAITLTWQALYHWATSLVFQCY